MAVDKVPMGPAAVRSAAWIPVMVDRIVQRMHPLRIVLFGSHARGEAHDESDVDLLVVMPDTWSGVRKREAAVQILSELSDLPVFKDVVVTTPEEIARRGLIVGTVLRLALQEGKVIYERP
jgi:uncharacterized protein